MTVLGTPPGTPPVRTAGAVTKAPGGLGALVGTAGATAGVKGTTGGIVEKAMPIHQSNVAIFNAATGKADRVGIKVTDGKRVRVFKSSGDEIKTA